MSLSVRERRVLADIERTLAQDDPRLARQMRQMRLSPVAEEPGPPPADRQRAQSPPPRQPAAAMGPPPVPVPADDRDERSGRGARRFTRWCAALALVLLVVSDLASSTAVLFAAGAVAVVSCAGAVAARKARGRDPGAGSGGGPV